MPFWAVILAAGQGSRLAESGVTTKKQFLEYKGVPLFWHSALSFARVAQAKGIVFVFPPDEKAGMEKRVDELFRQDDPGLPYAVVQGGSRRQDSVFNGLKALPKECTHVMVHDSARPFATPRLIQRLADALSEGNVAAIPGTPVTDTIKKVDGNTVVGTPRRDELFAVQTPQAFDLKLLVSAHEKALEEGWDVTDDAMMVERLGEKVLIVEGEAGNIKITNPEDLSHLKEDKVEQTIHVTGFGYDVHKYGKGRPLVLGGVPIPGQYEVVAHSDGDVLLHALTDAILGCAGLGDIGHFFPDNDAKYDNISSGIMLSEALILAKKEGVAIQHADLTIVAQAPKIGPHREQIRKSVAALLGLAPRLVNVKATTEEKLGFTGRKEGLKAVAVVSALRTLGERC